MTTPLYIDSYNLRFNTNLSALEYNSGNEVWVPVPVPTGDIGLTNGKILVGNASNLAAAVTMSGGATITNTGVVTLTPPLTNMHLLVGVGGVATDSGILQVDTTHNAVGINTTPVNGVDLVTNGSISSGGDLFCPNLKVTNGGRIQANNGSVLIFQNTFPTNAAFVFNDTTGAAILTLNTNTPGILASQPVTFSKAPIYPTSINNTATGTVTPAAATGVSEYLYTVTGALTINGPASGYDGQKIMFRLLQDSTGHTVTFATGSGNFSFGTTITSFTASGANLTDYVGCLWNAAASRWNIVSVSQGF